MLHDQAKAIVPILGCILFGFSCCLLGVACIRLSTAHTLQRVWLTAADEVGLLNPLYSPRDGTEDAGPSSAENAPGAGSSAKAGGRAPAQDAQEAGLMAAAHAGGDAPLLARLNHHISLLEQLIRMKRRGAAGGWLDVSMFKASCKFRGAALRSTGQGAQAVAHLPSLCPLTNQ